MRVGADEDPPVGRLASGDQMDALLPKGPNRDRHCGNGLAQWYLRELAPGRRAAGAAAGLLWF